MPSTRTDRLFGLTTSVAVKPPVLAASTGALTLESTQIIDGIGCSTGERVLVKDQADNTEHGIYVVQSSAWVRAADFDGKRDAVRGTLVYVSTGTLNGGEWWNVTSTGQNIPDGSSAITWAQTSHQIGPSITVSTFAETLLDDSSAVDMRATLGLVLGADVQAFDAQLADLAAQTPSTGGILFYDAGSSLSVLAKGSSGLFLQIGTSEPAWVAALTSSTGLGSPDFISAEQTVAADTALDVAHGLGAIPTMTHVVMRCVTADLGYSTGDELTNFTHNDVTDRGAVFAAGATNVTIIQGVTQVVVGSTTFNAADVTLSSWRWVVRAWL